VFDLGILNCSVAKISFGFYFDAFMVGMVRLGPMVILSMQGNEPLKAVSNPPFLVHDFPATRVGV
jgi:hypothetical protein